MRKCVLITFLSFILCGVEVCAKSMDFITIETAGLNMFFTISENKKVSFLYFGDRLVSDSRTTVLNKEYKLRREENKTEKTVAGAVEAAVQIVRAEK